MCFPVDYSVVVLSLQLQITDCHHMQPYHDPEDEPTAEPLEPSFFDFDNGDALGRDELKGWSVSSSALKLLTFTLVQ
jgi:hypothetical protein